MAVYYIIISTQSLVSNSWVMFQAAERVLHKLCGETVSAQFLGNAPCGFYQYRYPPAADLGTGAKVGVVLASFCLLSPSRGSSI